LSGAQVSALNDWLEGISLYTLAFSDPIVGAQKLADELGI